MKFISADFLNSILHSDKNHIKPDFMIIGTQKGGTTSLYKYISKHPNFLRGHFNKEKEIQFFSCYYPEGLKWYEKNFPTVKEKELTERKLQSKIITGEASTTYLFFPLCPKRIFQYKKDLKLIVMLRNPVYRAFSAYSYYVMHKQLQNPDYKVISFENFFLRESLEEHTTFELFFMHQSKKTYNRSIIDGCLHDHLAYLNLKNSKYVEQLKNWFEYFPKEQFLFIKSEDFFQNPQNTFKDVCQFLEIPEIEPDKYTVENKGPDSNYKNLNQSTKLFLADYFEPYNQELYKLLNRDFNWYEETVR